MTYQFRVISTREVSPDTDLIEFREVETEGKPSRGNHLYLEFPAGVYNLRDVVSITLDVETS